MKCVIVVFVPCFCLEAGEQESVMEDAEMQVQEMMKGSRKDVLLPSERNTEDDWFLLLDVPKGNSINLFTNLLFVRLSICLTYPSPLSKKHRGSPQ